MARGRVEEDRTFRHQQAEEATGGKLLALLGAGSPQFANRPCEVRRHAPKPSLLVGRNSRFGLQQHLVSSQAAEPDKDFSGFRVLPGELAPRVTGSTRGTRRALG